jgi:type VI secretion system protein ImpL
MQMIEAKKNIPWYLVLGPTGAGKSTLLAQGGLQFLEENAAHDHCSAWVSAEVGFLEIPSRYLTDESNLKKYIKQRTIAGIILVLDLAALGSQNKSDHQTQIQQVSQAIALLIKQLHVAGPLYLVFTKVDRLAGFSEFFADLGQEERAQVWGIDFPRKPGAGLSPLFKTQFDRLIKRLCDRVLWRLHQERTPQKRALMQSFPLQLESFKNKLLDVIYRFTEVFAGVKSVSYLQGVYFVSSRQQEKAIDFLQPTVATILTSPPAPTVMRRQVEQQSYFITQLFKKIIDRTVAASRSRFYPIHKVRLTIYATLVGVIVASSGWLAYSLNNKIAAINAAEKAVTQYNVLAQQLSDGGHYDLSQILPSSNALQQAVVALKQANLPWLVRRQQDAQALAEKTYHRALTHYFLPSLGDLLAQPLSNATDPTLLYGALKVYLMLGDPSHFNAVFIKNWFAQYWQRTLANNLVLQQQLNTHLAALLAHPVAPLELNQQIVTNARNLLTAMPLLDLADVVLKNRLDVSWVTPFSLNANEAKIFAQFFTAGNLQIPSYYTAAQFNDIYFHKISSACKVVANGDWIIGGKRSANEQELIKELQTRYVQQYADRWMTLLAGIQIARWSNWQQAQDALNMLLSKQSPLLGLLQTVAANTVFTKLVPAVNDVSAFDSWTIKTNLTDRFQGFNNLLPQSDTAQALNRVRQRIVQLRAYLTAIAAATDSNQAAFAAVKARFTATANDDVLNALRLTANTVPPLLGNWLNALADNSWRLLLDHAARYLDGRWRAEVLPTYDTQLNNRYPLFKTADEDIALENFTHFFAAHGILDNYFENYLAPFIDTNKTQWQWRQLDGQGLSLAPSFLAQLERAGIIRTMFFQGGSNLSVGFTLQALAFEPSVNRFAFTLNGRTFTDQVDAATTHVLLWPGAAKSSMTSAVFTDNQGQTAAMVSAGAWGLFKLLDKANLQTTNDPQRFILTFDLNGNAARYQLLANQIINPFLPHIIDQFRCPDKLVL